MTLGELLVAMFERDGKSLGSDGALSVISPLGWERHRTAQAWKAPFVAPSPNMPTLETALVYPGGCLLEGTNLSEGRGTTMPFQWVGAPFLDGAKLAEDLRRLQPPGIWVRPHSFRPSFSKFAGEICHGVALHVSDPNRLRPVATYLQLIALARRQAPEQFALLDRPYEFETDVVAFDLLTGSALARQALLSGAPPEQLADTICPVSPLWEQRVKEVEQRVIQAAPRL
jgi:uncharacterized protein YbbC (DUF1343 family)